MTDAVNVQSRSGEKTVEEALLSTAARSTGVPAHPASPSLLWLPMRAGAAITLGTTTTLLLITCAVAGRGMSSQPRKYIELIATVGSAAASDASWLLPLLFAAILAILAILVGQSFSEIPARDVDVNRRRLAAASWVISGIALTNLALAIFSLADPTDHATHLWAIAVSTSLIMGAAFWIGSFVFGRAEQQIRVLRISIESTELLRSRIPEVNTTSCPWRRVAFVFAITAAVSIAAASGSVLAMARVLQINPHVAWLPTMGVGGVAAICGCTQAALVAQTRDGSSSRFGSIVGTICSTAVATSPIVVIAASPPQHLRPVLAVVVVSLLVAYATPIASAFLPRAAFKGRTVRGCIDAVRSRSLSTRLEALNMSVDQLIELLLTEERSRPRHAR